MTVDLYLNVTFTHLTQRYTHPYIVFYYDIYFYTISCSIQRFLEYLMLYFKALI